MKQLVECVANFSEGRRIEVVDQIVAAIAGIDGVHVLDQESDPDHNRSVITFVGPPAPLEEAAYRAIQTAAELIDLNMHQGEHPRIGAADVVPFIPIEGLTMADCVGMARRLGERVGAELGIPVYLYEAAATHPDRENLATLRRGEYEGLKVAIKEDPNRQPDFGPAELGSAGAVVIGARPPLVAYNIYLTTSNVDIAKQIARAIRHSSGGLAFVKGLGLLVEGKAQVSMNLTDFNKTPIHRVVEMVRREAARYGVAIERSELIGLIPQSALIDSAQWYLQLDGFQPDQVLETRLAQVMAQAGLEAEQGGFLDALADGTPTPGGGSAAAYGAAMGASLVAMVARTTLGKKKYADVEGRMTEIIAEADTLRGILNSAVTRDADSFTGLLTAFRLPKDTDEQIKARQEAVESATLQAAEVPFEVAKNAARVLELAAEVAEVGNANAVSDAGSAGVLSNAALQAAGMNVKVNVNGLTDQTIAQHWRDSLKELDDFARQATERLHAAIRERGGIEV
jgi:glutamate formiminotransferase/formiminotetrahydrofolate cyclodeaminase